MKKMHFINLAICLMMMIVSVPVIAADTTISKNLEAPYEKVIAKNGSWYSERLTFEKSSELIVAYDGSYQIENSSVSTNEFNINIAEDILLKGICLPYTKKVTGDMKILLTDKKGNVNGPFKMQESLPNIIVERMSTDNKDKQNSNIEAVNYIFTPETEIIMRKGTYKVVVSNPELQVRNKETGGNPAYMIKGVSYSAYTVYTKKLREEEVKVKTDVKISDYDKKVGNEAFAATKLETYKNPEVFEKIPKKKPMEFILDKEGLISEIVINAFNGGKGASPGIITIKDEKGQEVSSYQSLGGTLADVPNGVWGIAPNIILPKGKYILEVSDPNVVTYDKSGDPQFYITLAPVPAKRYDFTGTYIINLETKKISTIMGPVNDGGSSFSLKDFELTILDKDGRIEFVGKYQGMPFSQDCKIVEESHDKVVAVFDFKADLTKLPYKAKISASATLTLEKPKSGKPKISITGTGIYEREATAEKGGDYNTHSINGEGKMKDKNLPPFVVAALGNMGGVGNIPGPGSPAQAAAGLLFPPLVGIVVNVLQEMLKPKPKEPKIKKYSLEWYIQQYPGKTREQLAWIILADAMGNTDEPDEDDKESVGDNEKTGNSEKSSDDNGSGEGYSSSSDSENESESEEEETENSDEDSDEDSSENDDSEEDSDEADDADDEDDKSDESNETESDGSDSQSKDVSNADEAKNDENSSESSNDQKDSEKTEDSNTDNQQQDDSKDGQSSDNKDKPDDSYEPETLTLQADHTGRTVTYVKDAETGQWVNPETGGVLDLERYYKDVAPSFEKDKQFIDEQRHKLETGDTAFDKAIREAERLRKEQEVKQAYIDRLKQKYGTDNEADLKKIIEDQQKKNTENFAAWKKAGDRYDTAEKAAKVVGVLADGGVDFLGNVTGPAGKGIKAGYKAIKGIAGTMAKDGVSASSFVSGAIKGGTDAAADYVKSPYQKAGIIVAGEVVGGAVGHGTKGAKDGLVDGVSKAIIRIATDKIGGTGYGNQVSTMPLSNGTVRVAIKSGDKWIGKTLTEASANAFQNKKFMAQGFKSGVKAVGGLLNEFGIKPCVTEPIKKNI